MPDYIPDYNELYEQYEIEQELREERHRRYIAESEEERDV